MQKKTEGYGLDAYPRSDRLIYGRYIFDAVSSPSHQGHGAAPPECPADPSQRLVRNKTFQRHALTAQGTVRVRIPRFLCRTCQCIYSARLYDGRPYTAWTWPILLGPYCLNRHLQSFTCAQ